ncbi:type II CAAX prenyl endopeptidase Rce1 family protein [Heyndrickxia acidicola]|uniref:CPBP family intramembrane metalloprotease n=1 Tax=Heyndrickxia acidicola TaxID=209389 RepID=A0ABU6MJI7_9BACI|nr:CPBP family intramembrane glutamic endopeptidase [Heyndrickxia acidicola]MED1204624.1 CPBP family intramembrane metalloprotease [Heyndrickxia acidicola]
MKTANAFTPFFRFSPQARKKLNLARLSLDITGLAAIYTFGSLVTAKDQWILSIYSVCAWITILTINPSHLPEASATRKMQKAAWIYFLKLSPLFAASFVLTVLCKKVNPLMHPVSIGMIAGTLINAVLYEVYFRNILQVFFRKWGWPVFFAIPGQSLLFALGFFVKSHSLPVMLCAFVIGLLTGFISRKTRSSQANIAVMAVMFWILTS